MNVNGHRISFACLLFGALLGHAKQPAAAVTCDKGNIFYVSADGLRTSLTDSGRDREPALHPGGEWVYFIRSFEGRFDEEKYIPPAGKQAPVGKMLQEELWLVRKTGADAQMLYRHDITVPCSDADHEVALLENIQFSPDGARIYVEASRWVTSAELRVMDQDGKHQRALGPACGTRVIQSSSSGDYRGFIVTSQHRYFVFGGSYDWYYLFTPGMDKEVGPIGENLREAVDSKSVTFVPTHRLE